jgi:enamine deaminase RidA (YjgF/YER057c/UK114 family)
VATKLGEVAEVAERARDIMATGRYNSDVVAEPFKAQLAVVFAHMERVLASQGATIDDVLRHNYLTTMGMREWGLASMVYRQQLYSSKGAAPTSTCVTVPYINSDPDVVLVSDAIALLPGEWKKEVMLDPETDMAHLPMTIAAGPYVFHTGYIAMDKTLHGPIRRLSELHDEGRFLGQTQFDSAESLVAQAWFTYREVNGMLQRAGTDLSRVVQQTVLMRDATQYAIIEQTVGRMFRGAVPPTTVIACDDIGPYPELFFEVEAVAVR